MAILLLPLLLAACGIRPKMLDPPPGAEKEVFPRIYPNANAVNTVPGSMPPPATAPSPAIPSPAPPAAMIGPDPTPASMAAP